MNSAGTLYLVATPIGNLGDISQRAIQVLSDADWIAAEDTRVTRKLLAHCGIKTRMMSYYEGAAESVVREKILQLLTDGKSVALVSDAGSPGISDPGYPLVTAAIEQGFQVISIPGPSAAICALQVSGLPTDHFAFFGFLPRKGKDRENAFSEIARFNGTSLLYESPKRLLATLQDLLSRFPNGRGCVCRELTKLFEETIRGSLDELVAIFENRQVKGEVVIALYIDSAEDADQDEAVKKALKAKKLGELSDKDAATITALFTGVSKNAIYKSLIKQKENE